ncbi:MAG: hypothetical protein JXR07_08835 [Reichenbachiella sp.]
MGQNTASNTSLAKGLGAFVFPAKGQDKATQDADELTCYQWAMQETGVDPLNPPQVQAAKVDSSPDGAAVRGAARGAAGGAAIGAIAGDAGKGAAIGATVGAVRGRRAKRYNDAKQQEINNAAAAEISKNMMNDFKKAFAACMTAKGYSVQL